MHINACVNLRSALANGSARNRGSAGHRRGVEHADGDRQRREQCRWRHLAGPDRFGEARDRLRDDEEDHDLRGQCDHAPGQHVRHGHALRDGPRERQHVADDRAGERDRGGETITAEGEYGAEGCIYQAYVPIPRFGNDYLTVGAWIVGDEPAGIGLREDATPITRNTSRFVPHYFF